MSRATSQHRHTTTAPVMMHRALITLFVAALLVPAAHGQDMPVPVDIQIPLFLKMLTFDRTTQARGSQPVEVGIVYQASNRNGNRAREEAQRAFARVPRLGNAEVRVHLINIESEDLEKALAKYHVTVAYVCPLRAVSIETLAQTMVAARVLTVTGVPVYAERGLAVSFGNVNERPQIIINLPASRRAGADFDSRVLALSKVIH